MVATRVVATGKEETLVGLPAMIAEVAMDAMAAVMAMKNALRSGREVVSVLVARKPPVQWWKQRQQPVWRMWQSQRV
jgi:translation elongation factor EF-4